MMGSNVTKDWFFDEESQFIFKNRFEFSKSGNFEFIKNIIKIVPEYQLLMKRFGNKPVYIFGSGARGKVVSKIYDFNFQGFVDNNENLWGGELNDLTIYGIDDIPSDANIFIAIANKNARLSVEKQLQKKRI